MQGGNSSGTFQLGPGFPMEAPEAPRPTQSSWVRGGAWERRLGGELEGGQRGRREAVVASSSISDYHLLRSNQVIQRMK